MRSDTSELEDIAGRAVEVAREAGALVLPLFQNVEVELKPDGSHVTEADRRAEDLIRDRLGRLFPSAAILGEEFGGESRALPGDQWIVDPVDGTTAFVLGLPLFGVLLGLLRDGDPVVGVAHFPALGETLWASSGAGCWFGRGEARPQRLSCPPVSSLGEAFVSVSGVQRTELDPSHPAEVRLQTLAGAAGRFRMGGDCVQHGLVCRGRLHVAIDAVMNPWDTAALVPCVREAGGAAASTAGDEAGVVFSGSLVSASTGRLLEQALEHLSPAAPA